VGSNSEDEDAPSPELAARESQEWKSGYERLRRIIAEFPPEYRDELEIQLGDSLLKWIRHRSSRIRNWNAYLDVSLRNRAKDLVKRWRKRDSHNVEFSSGRDPPDSQAVEPGEVQDSRTADEILLAFQRRLPNADRHFLKLLRERNGNISGLAQDIGCHRNTLGRQLRRIIIKLRRIVSAKCPIEIESAHSITNAPVNPRRAELEAIFRRPTASAREGRRVKVILAILDGRTYAEIALDLATSTATIARWRRRFEKGAAAAALIARHRGRKPSRAQWRLRKWLQNIPSDKRPSVRVLAERFGVGKSTVQRLLTRKA
jgi:DNA-directed RNA polymerase specialized sigma24 family protein